MSTMHLLAVFVQNQPRQTARVTRLLAAAGVNIYWLTIANNGSFGVMKFLVNKPEAAFETLQNNGLMVSRLEILAVEVPNEPGGLGSVAEALGARNINLANCSGFVSNHRAFLILEVQEIAESREILQKAGFRLISEQELGEL